MNQLRRRFLNMETEDCMEMTVSGTKNKLMTKSYFANDVQQQYKEKELGRKLEMQIYARLLGRKFIKG